MAELEKKAMMMYPEIAMEKAIKREEIMLRAYAKKISWIEAAEVLGLSCRHLRRIREKYEEFGCEICYAQLTEAESTAAVMTALRQVIETKGIFCSLYSDRASHFWLTPKAGEAVDRQSLTQLGRALRELGIKMIPAYSPQARGRSERSFRTWQGRLPQELRLKNITTVEEANRFLKRTYLKEFNKRFAVAAQIDDRVDDGSALVPCMRTDLDRVFSIQTERTVARDNTVKYNNLSLQIDKQSWRGSMEGCRVTVYQHLDGVITIGFGPHEVGKHTADGRSLKGPVRRPRELKPKRPAASLPIRQRGHLMC